DGFGRDGQQDVFEVVDLGQLAQRLSLQPSLRGTPLGNEAIGVVEALGGTITHHTSGPEHSRAFGVSIYLPAGEPDDNYTAQNVPFGDDTSWLSFVQAYAQHSSTDETAPEVEGAGVDDSGTLSATTVGDDIDRVNIALVRPEQAGLRFLGALPSVQGGGAS